MIARKCRIDWHPTYMGEINMRRMIGTTLGLAAVVWFTGVQADVTVLAVRLGAKDVAALAKFYETAFGLKEIDHVGQPPTEIIMRYGATAAAAKAGSSPEFLVARRDAGAANDPITHAVFRVSDLGAVVQAAKAAGAMVKSDVASISIGGMTLKSATLVDPDGNVLEIMELPKGATHLRHP
jgi:predicted enzyme related to lactoylglutathione lyase